MANSSNDNSGTGCLFFLAIGGYAIYQWSDSAGYTPHNRTVDVYMEGDWLVGKNRICWGIPDYEHLNAPAVLRALNCNPEASRTSTHNLNVKFWGRVTRPDWTNGTLPIGDHFAWRCTRAGDGFPCYALN